MIVSQKFFCIVSYIIFDIKIGIITNSSVWMFFDEMDAQNCSYNIYLGLSVYG